MIATYVDDICTAGSDKFQNITDKIENSFESKARVLDDFYFAGIHVRRDDEGIIRVNQVDHVKRLQALEKNCSFE